MAESNSIKELTQNEGGIVLFGKVGPTTYLPLKAITDGDYAKLEIGGVTLEAGDIQIGAVEIKDAATDARINVGLDSTKNAIYVQSESLAKESGNLASVKTNTDKLDVNLSTIASQSTLSTLNEKVTVCNTGLVTISSPLPIGDNTVGRVKITDETNALGITTDNEAKINLTSRASAILQQYPGDTLAIPLNADDVFYPAVSHDVSSYLTKTFYVSTDVASKIQFKIQESFDGGTSWIDITSAVTVTSAVVYTRYTITDAVGLIRLSVASTDNNPHTVYAYCRVQS